MFTNNPVISMIYEDLNNLAQRLNTLPQGECKELLKHFHALTTLKKELRSFHELIDGAIFSVQDAEYLEKMRNK